MSYTGGDASLFSHSSPYPSIDKYLNLDFQLGAGEQKALSGLVKGEDTIDVALYLGQSYGREPTKAGSPALPFPLWSLRISGPEVGVPPEISKTAYEALLELLPKETKEKLLSELEKPFQERATPFVALQGLLETAAKFVAKLEIAAKDLDQSSISAINREANLNLPTNAIVNLNTIADNVLGLADALLKQR